MSFQLRNRIGTLEATVLELDEKLTNLMSSAPADLNTLAELASSIDNDPVFSSTVQAKLDLKAPKKAQPKQAP